MRIASFGNLLRSYYQGLAFCLLGFFTAACGGMPEHFLKEELDELEYMAYPTPLTYAGVGTVVGGDAESMDIVASPDSCFPREIEGIDTELVKVDPTALPVRSTRFSVEGEAAANLVDVVNAGNPVFRGGVNFKRVYTIKLEFTEPKVEYIDQVNLARHYRDAMSRDCKDVLDRWGFIVQALHVEKMRFEFLDEKGVSISLNNFSINEIVKISPNISWKIENHTKLIIDTPKYIGYRLGQLKRSDRGIAMRRAVSADKNGEYIWESTGHFQKLMLGLN